MDKNASSDSRFFKSLHLFKGNNRKQISAIDKLSTL